MGAEEEEVKSPPALLSFLHSQGSEDGWAVDVPVAPTGGEGKTEQVRDRE